MRKSKSDPRLQHLRKRAERLHSARPGSAADLTREQIQELVHELQVHQIELEMQNDELRAAQLQLEESRQNYAELYDFAPVGYFTLDRDGAVLKSNLAGAKLLGLERSKLVGANFSRHMGASSREAFFFHLQTAAESPAKQACELPLVASHDPELWVRLETVAVHHATGEFKEFRMAALDITAQKKADARLRQEKQNLERANSELDNLIHILGHDLRAPVRAIAGFAGLLHANHKDSLSGEALDFLNETLAAAKALNQLMEDLFSLTKVERQRNPYEPVRVRELVDAVLNVFKLEMQTNGVRVDVQGELPVVRCDPIRTKEIFTNLISNAIKFSSKSDSAERKIRIACADKGGYHEFSVKDNGIGIPERHRREIFEMFRRLHTESEYSGTGAGLHITKKIVERHGGEIWVNSKEGKGTTFYFTLPKNLKNEADRRAGVRN